LPIVKGILKNKTEDEHNRRIAAAIEIQRAWRGYRTRFA